MIMANMEDLHNGLTDVSKQLVDTTSQYGVTADFLTTHVDVDVEVEVIAQSGRQIGAVLNDMPEDWRGPMAPIADTAKECTQRVTELAVDGETPPHEYIAAALAGLATMAEGANECDEIALQMRDSLQRALGHLAGFATALLEFERAAQKASEASRKSYDGSVAAVDGIRDYVMNT
jgi:hypothetical protein